MQRVEALPDTRREGAEAYANFDVNAYTQQMFGMFNGPLKKVTVRCENRFAGAMIDRFGTGPALVACADGDHFLISVDIQVSPRFFGWVAGFGAGVEIVLITTSDLDISLLIRQQDEDAALAALTAAFAL